MKALIIEDEINLARFLELELKDGGFVVEIAHDGRRGLSLALENNYDIILLDWMLPEKDGLAVLKEIRQRKHTPVIMITAKSSVESEVEGLDRGATDYLKKPFDNRQLMARVRVALQGAKNPQTKRDTCLRHGDIEVFADKRQVLKAGKIVELSKTQFDLLGLFLRNQGRVLTRDLILERCWGYESEVETNVVDVYVNHLRKKFGQDSLIRTVRGVGYVIDEKKT